MKDNNLLSEAIASLSPSKTGSVKQHASDAIKKQQTNSNTASTLRTASTTNQDVIKQEASGRGPLMETTFQEYELEAETLILAHTVDKYTEGAVAGPDDDLMASLENIEFHTHFRMLRGYSASEANEQKFYLPKSSIISVTGVVGVELASSSQASLEILKSSSQVRLQSLEFTRDSVGIESDPPMVRRRESVPHHGNTTIVEPMAYVVEEIPYNHDQTIISQGGLDTPSFTVPGETGSIAGKAAEDFTFGKASVDEGANPRGNESLASSILINDRNESFNGSFEPHRKDGLKVHTQRSVASEYIRGIAETQSNRETSPKGRAEMLSRNVLPHLRTDIFGKNKSSQLDNPRQHMTSRQHMKPRGEHGSLGNNSVDYGYMNRGSESRELQLNSQEMHSDRQNQTIDSCDDSERFNLYRNGPIGSDTDEADFAYDIGGYPLSDRDNFTTGSSIRSDANRKTIYSSRIEEIPVHVDANQFFLDDEVRSKYESLLQTSGKK